LRQATAACSCRVSVLHGDSADAAWLIVAIVSMLSRRSSVAGWLGMAAVVVWCGICADSYVQRFESNIGRQS
jgi:hypothetical protein